MLNAIPRCDCDIFKASSYNIRTSDSTATSKKRVVASSSTASSSRDSHCKKIYDATIKHDQIESSVRALSRKVDSVETGTIRKELDTAKANLSNA